MSLHQQSRSGVRGRLRRLLVRSRPRFWLYTAGPVLVGITYGATTTAELVTPLTVALVAYFLVPANVYLYGVNDVFDADADAVNPKKSDDDSTAPEVRYTGDAGEAAVVVACGLLGTALLAVVPSPAVPWLAGFLVVGAAYSVPPLRLKTTPFLDSASNGLYVLPGAGAYVAVAGQSPPLAALAGGWLWTMAMHTFSAVPDVEPDREAGLTTTATVLGRRQTLWYCGAVWALAALSFGLLDPRAGALLAA
jgi:4-hydroxybenzoate polyprenyltransferase